jgi:hypothetical protein
VKIVRTREEWLPIRARGKRWFLLRYGILGRGLPLAALCALAIEYSLRIRSPDTRGPLDFLELFVLALAVFSATGCLTANTTWNLYERRLGAPEGVGTKRS